MESPNYNFLAPFYKFFSRLVFGKALEDATVAMISDMGEKDKILIIGGGNGEILPRVFEVKPKLSIHYCELSKRFIGLAKKKNPYPDEQILFWHKDAFLQENFDYDFVLLPFFLDQFDDQVNTDFLKRIRSNSKPHTQILFADMNGEKIPKWLLSSMFVFFKVFTRLKQNTLPDFERIFNEGGWEKKAEMLFSKGKVLSRRYQKKEV